MTSSTNSDRQPVSEDERTIRSNRRMESNDIRQQMVQLQEINHQHLDENQQFREQIQLQARLREEDQIRFNSQLEEMRNMMEALAKNKTIVHTTANSQSSRTSNNVSNGELVHTTNGKSNNESYVSKTPHMTTYDSGSSGQYSNERMEQIQDITSMQYQLARTSYLVLHSERIKRITFNGEQDVNQFLFKFCKAADDLKLTDEELVSQALANCCGIAEDWCYIRHFVDFNDFKHQIYVDFNGDTKVDDAEYELMHASQKSNESIYTYLRRMNDLRVKHLHSLRMAFEFDDSINVKDQIISDHYFQRAFLDGIVDQKVLITILGKEPKSMMEIETIVKKMAKVDKLKLAHNRRSKTYKNRTQSNAKPPVNTNAESFAMDRKSYGANSEWKYHKGSNGRADKQQKSNLKCWKCLDSGHVGRFCTNISKLQCDFCKKSRHIAKNCFRNPESDSYQPRKAEKYAKYNNYKQKNTQSHTNKDTISKSQEESYAVHHTVDNYMIVDPKRECVKESFAINSLEFIDDDGRQSICLQPTNGIHEEITLLADTGSTICLCSRSSFDKYSNFQKEDYRATIVSGLGGSQVIKKYLELQFNYNGRLVLEKFYVVDGIMHDFIASRMLLKVMGYQLQRSDENVPEAKVFHHRVKKGDVIAADESFWIKLATNPKAEKIERTWKSPIFGSQLNAAGIAQLEKIIWQYMRDTDADPNSGTFPNFRMDIELVDKPSRAITKPYPMPKWKKIEMKRQLLELLAKGVISRTKELPLSCAFLVSNPNKPNKPPRLVIDVRDVNHVSKRYVFPPPNMNEINADCKDCIYFSKLDIRSGYFHMQLTPRASSILSFITHEGVFSYNKCPFGPKNAPSLFQEKAQQIFEEIQGVRVYIDDIRVAHKNINEHMQALKQIFSKALENRIIFALDKCEFGMQSIEFLGQQLSSDGLQPTEFHRMKALNIKQPTTKAEVRTFMGLCNWLSSFIPNLADIIQPICVLQRKNTIFRWSDECTAALSNFKKAVTNTQILSFPDYAKEFEICVDASDRAVGAILLQRDEHNCAQIIEFCSKMFGESQRNWHASTKEAFAVVYALERWAEILIPHHTIIHSDHRNHERLFDFGKTQMGINSKLWRWAVRVQEFDFTVHHIKGEENGGADFISRPFDQQISHLYERIKLKKDVPQECFTAKISEYGCNNCRSNLKWMEMQARKSCSICQLTLKRREIVFFCNCNAKNIICSECAKEGKQPLKRLKGKSKTENIALSTVEENESIEEALPLNNMPLLISRRDIIIAQKKDQWCTSIICGLEKGMEKRSKYSKIDRHRIKNGRYFIAEDGLLCLIGQGVGEEYRICIPEILRNEMIKHFHEGINGLHNGHQRMVLQMQQIIYWYGMTADTREYTRKCVSCQLTKGNKNKNFHQQSFVSRNFNSMVAIDIVGPMKRDVHGYNYCITMIDRYSRLLKIIPIKSRANKDCNIGAEICARAILKHWIYIYGIFDVLLSDRGSQFTGGIIAELERCLKFQKIFTTSYHPQTNGMLENKHRWIKQRLLLLMGETGMAQKWSEIIGAIEYGYNISKNKMTGFAPLDLILTEMPERALRKAWKLKPNNNKRLQFMEDQKRAETYGLRMANEESQTSLIDSDIGCKNTQSKMSANCRKESALAIQDAREIRVLKSRNANRKQIEFAVGDLVLHFIRNSRVGNERKGQYSWVGPFKIIGHPSRNVYKLQRDDRRHNMVNIENLKRWIE